MKNRAKGRMAKIFALWKFGLIEGIIIYFLMVIGFIPIILIPVLFMGISYLLFPAYLPEIYPIIVLNLVGIIWTPLVFGFIIKKRFQSWVNKNKDEVD